MGRRRWHVEYGRKYKIRRQQAVLFRRHARVGHAFQGRFKAILVERRSYLLELARYIVLNPVRAKMVKNPGRYPWSSYPATVGAVAPPSGLSTDWLLSQFAETRSESSLRRSVAYIE